MNRDVSLFWLLLHPQYNTRHKVWAQGLLNTLSADDSSTSGFCLVEEAPTLFIWEAGDQMVARAAVPLLKQFRYLLWGNRHTICNPRAGKVHGSPEIPTVWWKSGDNTVRTIWS